MYCGYFSTSTETRDEWQLDPHHNICDWFLVAAKQAGEVSTCQGLRI